MVSWYLVGGSVRDLLLGSRPRDLDFAFAGGVDAFVQTLPRARKVGKSVDVWLSGQAEFRPLQGESVEADLLARDLTINAMAVDENGRWQAHPRAVDDLRLRILRPASPSAFWRDPARVFRTARMAAEWPDFSVDEEVFQQMRELSGTRALAEIPAERVCREILRALAAPCPFRFLRILAEGKCLDPWLAELAGSEKVPAGPAPWHDNSVLEHTGEVMDRLAGEPLAVWMALCHDLGKMRTDPALLPHHYGHEERGAAMAEELALRLAMPRGYRRAGVLAARLHGKGGRYAHLRSGTRRDLLLTAHSAGLHTPFWDLVAADGGKKEDEELRTLAEADLAAVMAVTLPEEARGKGEESGRLIREMQCRAIASRHVRQAGFVAGGPRDPQGESGQGAATRSAKIPVPHHDAG